MAISEISFVHKVVVILTLLMTILIAIFPMSLSPYWNGTMVYKADKQQYAHMADALIKGHLYLDNGDVSSILEEMENPYDGKERERRGLIDYHWDEAYYNHHFYMYFGVVPTLVLFIPYKLITGKSLLSYQATQFFASFSIIGFFYLFYILCNIFFRKFPFSEFLILSSAFSILSIGYSIAAPALYCTAIVSGVCMMVWSIVCFLKGAWLAKEDNRGKKYLLIGSFLGAITFGCRPPVALANIIILPVIYHLYEKSHRSWDSEMLRKSMCVFVPYVVIGIILMLYNYARFDSFFEFGQSYQLTVIDQHTYGSFFSRFNLGELVKGLIGNFYSRLVLIDSFPFLYFNGAFINFPILLLSSRIWSEEISQVLKEKKIYAFTLLIFISPFIISLFDVYWAPIQLERYHLDFYYLLCIATFIAVAAWFEIISQKKKKFLICGITFLAFAVFVVEFLFFCIPFDGNYTYWYPEVLDEIYKGLRFGL
ncbi:MAG: hypothetical protein J6F33_07740 [Acidaminococcaceae bacterium]|nr:hypothetical protein [Acidaminococcaceae bacterium]